MVSLDPCMKIGPQVEEALILHTDLGDEERKARALKAMADADLPNPESLYNKYPHELSGGMLQRCMIAAAIISEPQLLLCDEPTTALDVTIQAEILKLLQRINREKGTSILFISHNLNVVKKLCTSILVMHKGLLVERGTPEEIFQHPREEYTKKLIAAIPTRTRKIRDMVDAERRTAGDQMAVGSTAAAQIAAGIQQG
ncbi:MAG: ABC transporter ATP-binding protein, partial [Lachnospiraceae bacterium]|nr:ABC transporter ATP-binding protein [Lachnospiraceae bacterium]